MRATFIRHLCTVACLVIAPITAQAQAETRCQIVEVNSGGVELVRGTQNVAAMVGHVLATGDELRTDPAGRVTVVCDTGLRMNVGPETRIALDELMVPDSQRGAVRLLEGIAGFLLPRPRSGGFEVHTPSAVAAVRSTEWAIAVEDRATATFVRDGRVIVAGSSGAVSLRRGEGVDVTAQSVVGDVRSWGEARVLSFDERIGPDWQARAR